MIPLLAAIDYSVFPPINATLNAISAVLLIAGVLLIKSGRRKAHQAVMISALVSSALFLACYLTYHYGAGHTEFPKEYPLARKIYLAILLPHILLAVVNLPFILLLVVAAARGNFAKHKRLARFTFPSWLFVSVTGVVIYFMIYHWFPPKEGSRSGGAAPALRTAPLPMPRIPGAGNNEAGERLASFGVKPNEGNLVFSPLSQTIKAEASDQSVDVLFTVENRGDQPVRIAKLESGCECLSVSIDANPVPASGKAVITGVFDISKMRGASERKIIVVPEGGSRPVFLTTRIEVDPLYLIEETLTTWEVGSAPETKIVAFRVMRDAPMHVLAAESKRPEVSCEVVEVEKGRLYHLKLTPRSTEKSLLGIVRIETDCEIEELARPLAYYSIQ